MKDFFGPKCSMFNIQIGNHIAYIYEELAYAISVKYLKIYTENKWAS